MSARKKAKLMTSIDATTQAKKAAVKVTPMTVDMNKRIEDMNAAEIKAFTKRAAMIAKEKAQEEKQNRAMMKESAKAEKQQALPAEPLVLIPESGIFPVPLSALMPLDNGLFPDGEYAIRKIDPDHVRGMVLSLRRGEELPPLTTVQTNFGSFVLDGLHRLAAHIEYMKELMFEQDRITSLDDKKQSDDDKRAIFEEMQRYTTLVDQRDFETPGHAIDFAFQANAKHGLKQSQQSKAQYGLWLHKWMKEKGTPMSLRAIAEKLGITHQTLTVTRDRMLKLKKPPKMVDALTEEDNNFLDESAQERETPDRTVDTDNKHIAALIAAARHFANASTLAEGGEVDKTGTFYLKPKLAKVQLSEIEALQIVVNEMVSICQQHMYEGGTKQQPLVGFKQ